MRSTHGFSNTPLRPKHAKVLALLLPHLALGDGAPTLRLGHLTHEIAAPAMLVVQLAQEPVRLAPLLSHLALQSASPVMILIHLAFAVPPIVTPFL